MPAVRASRASKDKADKVPGCRGTCPYESNVKFTSDSGNEPVKVTASSVNPPKEPALPLINMYLCYLLFLDEVETTPKTHSWLNFGPHGSADISRLCPPGDVKTVLNLLLRLEKCTGAYDATLYLNMHAAEPLNESERLCEIGRKNRKLGDAEPLVLCLRSRKFPGSGTPPSAWTSKTKV